MSRKIRAKSNFQRSAQKRKRNKTFSLAIRFFAEQQAIVKLAAEKSKVAQQLCSDVAQEFRLYFA